jgi:hypothetical protein
MPQYFYEVLRPIVAKVASKSRQPKSLNSRKVARKSQELIVSGEKVANQSRKVASFCPAELLLFFSRLIDSIN